MLTNSSVYYEVIANNYISNNPAITGTIRNGLLVLLGMGSWYYQEWAPGTIRNGFLVLSGMGSWYY